MDWDNPQDRYNLINSVGIDEYNRQHAAHMEKSTVARVAGHSIRTVNTRFGLLYHVGGTPSAFASLEQATQYAEANPAADVAEGA